MALLLDSVILIDHFNGVTAATEYLRQNWTSASVSVITRAEVLTGFQVHRETLAKQLLDRFPTLPAAADDADLAAALRRQYRWKLPDALQAAIAVNHRLKLATRNTRDFDPAQHSFVVIPYSLT
jgi:predicted nucleic acid-binding protein